MGCRRPRINTASRTDLNGVEHKRQLVRLWSPSEAAHNGKAEKIHSRQSSLPIEYAHELSLPHLVDFVWRPTDACRPEHHHRLRVCLCCSAGGWGPHLPLLQPHPCVGDP